MNQAAKGNRRLSERAEELIRYLQQSDTGDGFGVPSIYPGPNALSTHAIAYLSNAAQLCGEDAVHDFSVFGAFYCFRHGLELWLKYLMQNSMIDRALLAVFDGKANSLDAVAREVGLHGKKQKQRKEQLSASFCALRNIWQDNLVYPDVWTQNMSVEHASQAILLMRTRGGEPRSTLASVWRVSVPGHSVKELWADVYETLVEYRAAAIRHVQRIGGGPVDLDQLEAAVDFVDYFDPDGDAFRYPASLAGDWYLHLPCVNLLHFSALARGVEETVRAYEALLEYCYEFARLRSPEPSPPTL